MKIFLTGVGQSVERLVRNEQPPAVGAPRQASQVLAGNGFDAFDSGTHSIHDGQLPAECPSHDERFAVGTERLQTRREREGDRFGDLETMVPLRIAQQVDDR